MRNVIVFGIALAGLLGASDAMAQVAAPPRPMTRGQQITAQADAKYAQQRAVAAEVRAQRQKEASRRYWGNQDYYRGPKGNVINGRDLQPGAQQNGYRFLGSRSNGQPQAWQKPSR